jgi:hypothetical protein
MFYMECAEMQQIPRPRRDSWEMQICNNEELIKINSELAFFYDNDLELFSAKVPDMEYHTIKQCLIVCREVLPSLSHMKCA